MSDIRIVKPTLNDVDDIYKLVFYFAKKGDILPRSKDNIAERIREFQCAKDGENIIGVSSLRIFYPYLAEIRSIAIYENYQSMGIGKMLVSACIEEAKYLNVKDIFALTFKREFFLRLGFRLIDKKELPSNKIWEDCIHCQLFPNCKEEAVIYSIS